MSIYTCHNCLLEGKSLFVTRMFQNFKTAFPKATYLPIRLIEPNVDVDCLVQTLCEKQLSLKEKDPVLLHIDTAAVCFTPLCCIILSLFFYNWSILTFYRNSRFFLTQQVRCGLEEFLFRLLILGSLSDSDGKLWRRNTSHLIAVETLLPDSALQKQLHKDVSLFLSSVTARLKSFFFCLTSYSLHSFDFSSFLLFCNLVLSCYKVLYNI